MLHSRVQLSELCVTRTYPTIAILFLRSALGCIQVITSQPVENFPMRQEQDEAVLHPVAGTVANHGAGWWGHGVL